MDSKDSDQTELRLLGYFFHILVLPEYWVLTESRKPLKPVLGGVRIVLFSYIVGPLYF